MAIAVITYQRPNLLAQLLQSLADQRLETESLQVRIVVVDNDPKASAEGTVQDVQPAVPWAITYVAEADPGIPSARQRSVDLCPEDDVVIFVDDDEICPQGWLQALITQWQTSGADVVTGPVHGILPPDVPSWNRYSDVHSSRGKHRTGELLTKAYTNNTLVTRVVLDAVTPTFDPRFRFSGSSDLHFFQRVHRAGFAIVWCEEAEVREHVPPERTTLRWLVRRAFRSGAGDTISRRLIRPGVTSIVEGLAFATARLGSGVALMLVGLLPGQGHHRIKGVRRFFSAAGSYAGLIGINYNEYRRSS
ncbi:glycosyltransferase family 2 protein [Pseudactinotalea sp. Z1748]|uniref:glycosyltransferase family 2 protein n=1 Tax=Pseudactinotalea sp. Z1748 TaxID=3413027 RepID=UPI003C7E8573